MLINAHVCRGLMQEVLGETTTVQLQFTGSLVIDDVALVCEVGPLPAQLVPTQQDP
jgi:hypothetical protein